MRFGCLFRFRLGHRTCCLDCKHRSWRNRMLLSESSSRVAPPACCWILVFLEFFWCLEQNLWGLRFYSHSCIWFQLDRLPLSLCEHQIAIHVLEGNLHPMAPWWLSPPPSRPTQGVCSPLETYSICFQKSHLYLPISSASLGTSPLALVWELIYAFAYEKKIVVFTTSLHWRSTCYHLQTHCCNCWYEWSELINSTPLQKPGPARWCPFDGSYSHLPSWRKPPFSICCWS